MEKLKELRRAVEHIHSWLSFYQSKDSGRVSVTPEGAKGMFEEISKIYQILTELEKIENYTSQSTSSKEMVSHPDHYQGGKIECIEAMLDVFGKKKVSAFCELNAFKYLWRANSKGTDIQDKKKAIWYLDKYVELNGKQQ